MLLYSDLIFASKYDIMSFVKFCYEPDFREISHTQYGGTVMLYYEPPSLSHKADLLAYRREIFRSDKNFDGTAGLGNFNTITEWLERLFSLEPERAARFGYYPTVVYLAYSDKSLAGIVNIRLSDDEFLRRCAGHIGYNVRPSMRRKGFAREMLFYAVSVCRENGIINPVVCTEPGNIPSQKTALSCGFRPGGESTLDNGEKICRFIYPSEQK